MSASLHPGLRPQTLLALTLLLLSPLALAGPRLWGHLTAPTTGPGEPREGNRTIEGTRPILGYAIVAHHIGDLDLYLESVDKIAELGANALTIVTPLFQEYADSSEIEYLAHKCPTPDQLVAILQRARARGMMTTLQPIVLIRKPGKKEWRGVIRPKDWDAWWTSYDRLIDRFLRVADEADVDMFVVGSELNTTEDQHERWRAVVEKVRARFDGQITYSANWDRYHKVDLWPMVDAISVSSYFELERHRPGAPRKDLIEAWAPIREKLVRFAEEWDKPLLLSEVGYPSLPWANAHPWNYVADGERADHEMQARCYEAFFAAWTPVIADSAGPVAGFTCYHWDPYHHGQSTDTGYGVEGKPARQVIERGFERIRELAEDGSRPAATQPATRPTNAPAD